MCTSDLFVFVICVCVRMCVLTCMFVCVYVDHSYEELIENQPIGKCLFVEFCSEDVTLSKCHHFMTALDDFALVAEEKSAVTAQKIFQEFLSPEVRVMVKSWCFFFNLP